MSQDKRQLVINNQSLLLITEATKFYAEQSFLYFGLKVSLYEKEWIEKHEGTKQSNLKSNIFESFYLYFGPIHEHS